MGVVIALDQEINANVFARKVEHGCQMGLVHHLDVAAFSDGLTLELRADPPWVGLQGQPVPFMCPLMRTLG
jgi:hypothetical protein